MKVSDGVYVVYVLYSKQYRKTYVGQTSNLSTRLRLHNSGKVRSTKVYSPWVLIYSENYASRSKAMNRENWFKSPTGRKFIVSLFDKEE